MSLKIHLIAHRARRRVAGGGVAIRPMVCSRREKGLVFGAAISYSVIFKLPAHERLFAKVYGIAH
jgi:hypothetical protein